MRHSIGMAGLVLFLVLSVAWPVSAGADRPACPVDTQEFWERFRGAALAGRVEGVMELVRFPFDLRGPLDADGARRLDPADFAAVWPHLLAADPGLPGLPDSMGELARAWRVLPPAVCVAAAGQVRVGTWLFQRIDGRWRMVTGFLDEP